MQKLKSEIGRIAVPGHLNGKKLGLVVHTHHPNYIRKFTIQVSDPGRPEQKAAAYLQNNQRKNEGMAEVIAPLPPKCEV
jgi:hypothetical protein